MYTKLLLSPPHMLFRLTRLCHLVPQAQASGFCGAGFDGILFPQTCEKIVLFLGLARGKFTRTFWRRCLTPHRGGV